MAGTGEREADGARSGPLELWLEAAREALARTPMGEGLRARCEEMLAAWGDFAAVYSQAAERAGAGPATGTAPGEAGTQPSAASPFDPLAWIDAAAGGGLGDLWRLFTGGAPLAPTLAALAPTLVASPEWAAYAGAMERFRQVMAEGWQRAWQAFAARAASEGVAAGEPQRLVALWQEEADRVLAETMRSEAFLAAQERLIEARLDCSEALRRQTGELARFLGLATGAEVVALAERLHALERRLEAAPPEAGGGGAGKARKKGGRDG